MPIGYNEAKIYKDCNAARQPRIEFINENGGGLASVVALTLAFAEASLLAKLITGGSFKSGSTPV